MRRPDHLSRQLRLISIGIITVSGTILAVLIYFQIYEGDRFERTSQKNCLRHKSIDSLRGAILDRKGRALATNRPLTSLVWKGTGNAHFNEQQRGAIEILRMVLRDNVPDNETLASAEKRGAEFLLRADLPFEELSAIMERCMPSSNLSIRAASTRFYPYGLLGCHVIGYFRSSTANHDTSGLEHLYEEQLRGEPGECAIVVNATGQSLQSHNVREARDGQTLETTLDFDVQKIAEGLFEADQGGALVAMDPEDGSLLAVVSRPGFDPNMFVGPVSAELWQRCVETKPFINKAFSACYPPASLFKLVTTTAALEEGIATPQSCWHCNGSIMFGNYTYHCNRAQIGHGPVNLEEAIAQSCNIAFYDIGKRIHIDRLAHYAQIYGLGTPTGVSLPEKPGLIPTSRWKKQHLHEAWWQGETLQVCIGQTYVTVTPLQVACMIGSIFTGSLTTPRILVQEPIGKKVLPLRAETRKFVQQAMKSAIAHGTGRILRSLKKMEIHGKTGTAQTHHRSKHKLGHEYLPHGWFACHARYRDHDPIVLVIMVEHAGSSAVPAAMAKKFFLQYCELLDGSAQAVEEEPELAEANVPDTPGASTTDTIEIED
ncbi:MAG: penicillin-binding transpeptidase domain-containing protein [Candidatus Dependentiae bacterium]|nr:penicillin-binding transpeptidase domain-containing protein [Candidatus Dependentiae bacterium]